jgi:2-keto-4-pentenoate hydratase/2-oxohepta-3-ene-1,7-dioic acid hydratase in catechol pathway
MKLIRFGSAGSEKPGLEVDGTRYDVSHLAEDYTEVFLADDGINLLKREFDPIIIPKNSQKTDWEVELAVVMGRRANYISREEALDYVAGYVLHNDVSEREFQLERGGQWVKGKSCDTFSPIGPYLVTTDEIPDPNNLRLWLPVNGKMVQDGHTSDFIFNVQEVISYLSQFMSLMPGDIISTGTPEGVGLGFDPPVLLKDGDVVELGVEGLGSARQLVRAWPGE